MDLGTLANVATAFAVIVALTFGVTQWRADRRRDDAVAVTELVHTILTPEMIDAHTFVLALPDGFDRAAFGALPPGDKRTIRHALFLYENLGALVFRRVIPIDYVDDLLAYVAAWSKLEKMILEGRAAAQGNPRSWEWFEWLADRLRDRGRQGAPEAAAHLVHRAWKP